MSFDVSLFIITKAERHNLIIINERSDKWEEQACKFRKWRFIQREEHILLRCHLKCQKIETRFIKTIFLKNSTSFSKRIQIYFSVVKMVAALKISNIPFIDRQLVEIV